MAEKTARAVDTKPWVLLGLSALSPPLLLSTLGCPRDFQTCTCFLAGCRPLSVWYLTGSELSLITQIFLVAMLLVRQLCRKLAWFLGSNTTARMASLVAPRPSSSWALLTQQGPSLP